MVTPCIPGYHLYRAADGSQPPRIPAAPAWDTIPYDEPKVSLEKKGPIFDLMLFCCHGIVSFLPCLHHLVPGRAGI